ncbi:hypothetical protein TBLA_0D04250 [Henningerozyma blattae CBS 6284]|uniref:Uncharacterized protein n=1 Tax=Henningerozyma blattae (strain ATCC 34711 / CBS 6284 / DSM 70876 / NBRC 10599 / NRRL Y-10934 / UCD 77-7) TaxID=1071380 RepID=I2H3H0_HENB6|nr:hypothetical protein TBLA_0D04250 [Tetrapisispora blattae CBS 6284]CCH60922.1 hypothetical protein TBLA_0D04250 [Tetrapisispora blattae CBS 6284]
MIRGKLLLYCILTSIVTLVSNVYIRTYPSIHPQKCSWACASKALNEPNISPLSTWEKMLYYTRRYYKDVLSNASESSLNTSDVQDIHMLALGDPQIKGAYKKTTYLQALDIYMNDHYLGHIFKTMQKRLDPGFIAVLGDLFSSQWISDSEFFNRTMRYNERLFKRNSTYLHNIQKDNHDENGQYKVEWSTWGTELNTKRQSPKPWNFDYGYSDVYSWNPEVEDFLFLNVTGNHDIGYSGDVTYQHRARYEELFGKDNYWIEYDIETDHPWRIVVLDTLLLEGPALQPEFLEVNWEFLEQLKERNFSGSTVLLTHVPFYKPAGLCSDGPSFSYYPEVWEKEPYKANLLRSQNHLSEEVSNTVLNSIFNNGKPGVILTGHDHVGCETIYSKNIDNKWFASKIAQSNVSIKEITVRSMMGEFDGNSGLLTGHFNHITKNWEWNFSLCPFAIQHVWWFANISICLTIILWSFYFI